LDSAAQEQHRLPEKQQIQEKKNLALTISTGEDIHRAKTLELRAEIEENKLLVRRTSGET
jgi:hypothetical protein